MAIKLPERSRASATITAPTEACNDADFSQENETSVVPSGHPGQAQDQMVLPYALAAFDFLDKRHLAWKVPIT